ncbi:unnamed protein product, partial [Linum tenue]
GIFSVGSLFFAGSDSSLFNSFSSFANPLNQISDRLFPHLAAVLLPPPLPLLLQNPAVDYPPYNKELSGEMDPDSVKSTLSNLAFGNVMAAAARNYQKEILKQEKAQPSANQEIDLDELMDDPELEKLHADRIAALKREAEKRESLKRLGHGEYREITEGDFLSEVTKGDKVICHFYHKEFYRCKIVDKHLKALAPKHVDTKFVKLDAENAPFFVAKLGIKTLPCVILFRKGIAADRLVGFQDLGGKDDFPTTRIENYFIKKGIISEKKKGNEDEEEEYDESRRRTVRSSLDADSDSD